MSAAIGIEIGAASMLAIAVDEAGRLIGRTEQIFRPGEAPAAATAAALAVSATGDLVSAPVGVAAYEPRSPDASTVCAALKQRFRVPAPAASLGSAVAIAETWCGAARDARDVVCLLVGEHVAAGVLLNGRPWTGAHGLAGSVAWLALNPVERQDYRQRGCLDSEISSRGIARRLAWRVEAGDPSAVVERAGGLEAVTAQHVLEGARSGDGVATSVVRDTVRYVAMAITNLCVLFDPEIVVLGGIVATAPDLLLEPVRLECQRRLSPELFAHLRLAASALGDAAAAIGAARLASTTAP